MIKQNFATQQSADSSMNLVEQISSILESLDYPQENGTNKPPKMHIKHRDRILHLIYLISQDLETSEHGKVEYNPSCLVNLAVLSVCAENTTLIRNCYVPVLENFFEIKSRIPKKGKGFKNPLIIYSVKFKARQTDIYDDKIQQILKKSSIYKTHLEKRLEVTKKALTHPVNKQGHECFSSLNIFDPHLEDQLQSRIGKAHPKTGAPITKRQIQYCLFYLEDMRKNGFWATTQKSCSGKKSAVLSRIYNTFTNMPSILRSILRTKDGDSLVIIDATAMQPNLLAKLWQIKEKQTIDIFQGDAHTKIADLLFDGDRNRAKKTILHYMNSPFVQIISIEDTKLLYDFINEKYPSFENWFRSLYSQSGIKGIRPHTVTSRLMAHLEITTITAIIKNLSSRNIHVGHIHDALIVSSKNVEIVEKEFQKVLNDKGIFTYTKRECMGINSIYREKKKSSVYSPATCQKKLYI